MPQSLAQNYEQIPSSAFHPKGKRSESAGAGVWVPHKKATGNKGNEQKQREAVGEREWSRAAESKDWLGL